MERTSVPTNLTIIFLLTSIAGTLLRKIQVCDHSNWEAWKNNH